VTVHERDVAALEEVWAAAAAEPRVLGRGVDFVYYLVADGIVDDNFPHPGPRGRRARRAGGLGPGHAPRRGPAPHLRAEAPPGGHAQGPLAAARRLRPSSPSAATRGSARRPRSTCATSTTTW
jgi:hypothetical protein